MFRIIFPLLVKGDIETYKAILPAGYDLSPRRFNEWAIIPDGGTRHIGHCTFWPRRLVLAIDVNEKEAGGKLFWEAFSWRYRDLNPFQTFYGVVYPSETGEAGHYELDALFDRKMPDEDVVAAVARYAGFDDAYFVMFQRGHWQRNISVEATVYLPINKDGTLGSVLSSRLFNLAVE